MQWNRWYILFMTIVFAISPIIRGIVHKKMTGKSPLVVGKNKRGLSKYYEISSLAALGIVYIFIILYCIYGYLDEYLPFISILNTFYSKIFASFIIMIGYASMLTAFVHMGKSYRVGIDLDTKDKLVTEGIFSFSRNPIYIGIIFYFTGVFLMFPNLLFLIVLLRVILGIHWQILKEEGFLKGRYGRDYEVYSGLTGRYFTIGKVRI